MILSCILTLGTFQCQEIKTTCLKRGKAVRCLLAHAWELADPEEDPDGGSLLEALGAGKSLGGRNESPTDLPFASRIFPS